MSNNMFGELDTDGVKESEDRIGGSGPVESGVYKAKVKAAYGGQSSKGSKSLTVLLELEGGRELRQVLYVTNQKGETFWIGKNDPNKEKNPLPGFTTADELCLVATGFGIKAPQNGQEERVFNIYDFETRKEEPTKVKMIVNLTGKELTVAVIKKIVDKNKLVDGEYVPSGETREENEIVKVFHTATGKTVPELRGKRDATFQAQWAAKNTGVTLNKASAGATAPAGKASAAAAPQASEAATTESLFGE